MAIGNAWGTGYATSSQILIILTLLKTFKSFWRRLAHIAHQVGSKDYLCLPLGGHRKGTMRTYINLLVTMLLGGLWHGASCVISFSGVFGTV